MMELRAVTYITTEEEAIKHTRCGPKVHRQGTAVNDQEGRAPGQLPRHLFQLAKGRQATPHAMVNGFSMVGHWA